MQTAAEYMCVF